MHSRKLHHHRRDFRQVARFTSLKLFACGEASLLAVSRTTFHRLRNGLRSCAAHFYYILFSGVYARSSSLAPTSSSKRARFAANFL